MSGPGGDQAERLEGERWQTFGLRRESWGETLV